MGTVARVKQLLKLPNGTFRVLVEGISRGKVLKWVSEDPCYVVQIEQFTDNEKDDMELEALRRTMLEYFEQYIKLSKKLSADIYTSVMDIQQAGRMADIIASHLPLKLEEKQRLLEAVDVKERVHQIIQILHNEKEILHLEKRISQRVKQSMERTQKEYYLREQMKAIQKELGEKEGKAGEIELLREKIEQAGMPEHVKATALKELDRYEKVPAASAESGVIRNYLDWLLALPWTKQTEDIHDIHRAEKILNEEHYGLETVKERVLEYLAVQQLTNSLRGAILCLVGAGSWKNIARSFDCKNVKSTFRSYFARWGAR